MGESWYEQCVRLYGKTRSERLQYARSLGTHEKYEWLGMAAIHKYSCVKCGADNLCGGIPTKDHIVPIFIGGSDAIENIQPLCRQCNSGKNDCKDYRLKTWKRKLKKWIKENIEFE